MENNCGCHQGFWSAFNQEPISVSQGDGPMSIGRDSGGRQLEKYADGVMVFPCKANESTAHENNVTVEIRMYLINISAQGREFLQDFSSI